MSDTTTTHGAASAAITLDALHHANIIRQAEWCAGGDPEPDLAFRGVELAGETGEALNVIKKLERERRGWRGSRASMSDLAEELADVVICADLCAVSAGIDLGAAVVAKFNATSEKVGLTTMLATPQAENAGLREALAEARQWVEANTANVRGLSAEAAAPGEAMLRKIDAALSRPQDQPAADPVGLPEPEGPAGHLTGDDNLWGDKPVCEDANSFQNGMSSLATRPAQAPASAGRDGVPPHAGWLWSQLMDFCRKRRFPPAEFSDLFEIVRRARTEEAALAPAAQPDRASRPSSTIVEVVGAWATRLAKHGMTYQAGPDDLARLCDAIIAARLGAEPVAAWLQERIVATEQARDAYPDGSEKGAVLDGAIGAYVTALAFVRQSLPIPTPASGAESGRTGS